MRVASDGGKRRDWLRADAPNVVVIGRQNRGFSAERAKISRMRITCGALYRAPHVIRILLILARSAEKPRFWRPMTTTLGASALSQSLLLPPSLATRISVRSEERRVGEECRSRWSPYP